MLRGRKSSTLGTKVAVGTLRPHDAAQAPHGHVSQLDAAIVATILEARADFTAFDFVMLLVSETATYTHSLKTGKRIAVISVQVSALAAQAHIRNTVIMRMTMIVIGVVVMILLAMFVMVARGVIVAMIVAAAMLVRAMRVAAFVSRAVTEHGILAVQAGDAQADTTARRDP